MPPRCASSQGVPKKTPYHHGHQHPYFAGSPRFAQTELHLHIEGTLEPELALRLADRNGVTLPFDGIDELRSHYRFDNLQSFLDLYYQLMSVLRTREDFSDLMFDYLAHAHADGVHRAEIFFDPQVHMNNGLDYDLVLDGLLDGIARGRA